MTQKSLPWTQEQIESIVATHATPFHIYDEAGILHNMRRFLEAFAWVPGGVRNYFAVKATPNPHIMASLQTLGVGADCSSMAELLLCERIGMTGEDILFSSNNTPYEEYAKAMELGAIINLDDISHIAYLEEHGSLPERLCFRFNPGPLKEGGNELIGFPEEAKYGMTEQQIVEAVRYCRSRGVRDFGLHTMVVSNELSIEGHVGTAELMFTLANKVYQETGVAVDLIDLGGGIGIPYRPEETAVDYERLSERIRAVYEAHFGSHADWRPRLVFECGRMVTGPYGYLVTKAIHHKDIYKQYVGVDACMANLMRPALYGSYHHITVVGKERAPHDHVYDVTGSLCENNDKFAIDRALPRIERGDILVIHDAGAHGHAMGFNYNGKLRSAELFYRTDGSVDVIRRAETIDDYFATLDWDSL